jgi:tetratricopeptide (TPR) repeat protein
MTARYLLPLAAPLAILLSISYITIIENIPFNLSNGFQKLFLSIGLLSLLLFVTYIVFSVENMIGYYHQDRDGFKASSKFISQNMLPGDMIYLDDRFYGYVGVIDYYPERFGFISNAAHITSIDDSNKVIKYCQTNKNRLFYLGKIWQQDQFFNDELVNWLKSNNKCLEGVFKGFLLCSCGPTTNEIRKMIDNPNKIPLINQANANRSIGNWKKAIKLYNKILEVEPDNQEAIDGLLLIGKVTNDHYTVIENLIKLVDLYPNNLEYGKLLRDTIYQLIFDQPQILNDITESNNLLKDGSFSQTNEFWGEQRDDFSYKLEVSEVCRTTRCLLLEGKSQRYHGGISTQMKVKGNQPYLFAGWFLAQNANQLKGRLVYWENNGSTSLGWKEFVGEIPNWRFEWTIVLIPPEQNVVNLNPALIEGEGKVWIDDLIFVDLVELFKK